MILYHGTTNRFLRSIMRRGVLPRSLTGHSTYEGELKSHEDRVYLTDTYPIQFGINAVAIHGGNLLVIACEVKDSLLEPDTDFIEGSKHDRKFIDGTACLECTGCCSVVGKVTAQRMWVLSKKQLDEIIRCDSLRIETSFRHSAFKKLHLDQLERNLMLAKRYELREGTWYDDLGRVVIET